MKRIVVTGAAGSVGSALVKHLLSEGNLVCALDQNEEGLFNLTNSINENCKQNFRPFLGDIRDKERLVRAFEEAKTIYHCAAYKHVHLCEYNAFEAVKTNINGTQNIIDASIEAKVEDVVLTSSDKAVNPSSAMGSTKLVAEKLFCAASQWSKTKFCSVRFGNVWNTSGSVAQIWKKQYQKDGEITLTTPDMTRFFISMKEAIDICIYGSEHGKSGDIIIGSMKSLRLGDLVKKLQDHNKNLKIKVTGIKEGEKLYEELCSETEQTKIEFDGKYYVIKEKINKGLSDSDLKSSKYRSDNKMYFDESLLNNAYSSIIS